MKRMYILDTFIVPFHCKTTVIKIEKGYPNENGRRKRGRVETGQIGLGHSNRQPSPYNGGNKRSFYLW